MKETVKLFRSLLKYSIICPLALFGSNVAGEKVGLQTDSSKQPNTAQLLYYDTTFANCGFYACEFILQHFGIKSGKSMELIDFGPLMEKAISFSDISRMAKTAGLKCAAYSNVRSDVLLSLLNDETIILLQTLTSKGHHYQIIGKSGEKCWICDPGIWKIVDEAKKIGEYIDSVSTGNILIVSRTEIDASTLNSLTSPGRHFDALKSDREKRVEKELPKLGFEIPDTVVVEKKSNLELFCSAPIIMSNRCGYDIKIEKVTGSCGCFREYEGPKIIPAGTTSSGRLIFTASSFNVKDGTMVAILTNYKNKPVMAVNVTANSLPQHGVMLTPSVINLGLCNVANGESICSFFLLKSEGDPIRLEGTIEDSISSDRAEVKICVEKLSPFRISEKLFSGYQVNLKIKPATVGFFRYFVTIKLDRESGGESSVLVTGYTVKS